MIGYAFGLKAMVGSEGENRRLPVSFFFLRGELQSRPRLYFLLLRCVPPQMRRAVFFLRSWGDFPPPVCFPPQRSSCVVHSFVASTSNGVSQVIRPVFPAHPPPFFLIGQPGPRRRCLLEPRLGSNLLPLVLVPERRRTLHISESCVVEPTSPLLFFHIFPPRSVAPVNPRVLNARNQFQVHRIREFSLSRS